MEHSRLMIEQADYDALGILGDKVQPWEDGRRDDGRAGSFEWWYFDAILDDGTKMTVAMCDKRVAKMASPVILPQCEIRVTLPDGTSYGDNLDYPADEASYGKNCCNVKIGPHCFTGDLKEYHIKVEPVNGLGADLTLTSMSQPWRPGAGYFRFNEQEDQYFTWLCCVPRGRVAGTLTVNGETRNISGYGYHDHQWGCISPLMAWNHWFWIRQNVGDYSILVFDFVGSQKYGYKRYPLAFIEDKDGNIIFENYQDSKFEVLEEYLQEKTQKVYPRKFKYTFENDGKTVEYTITVQQELEIRDEYMAAPEQARAMFDAMNLKPSYTRYSATGDLTIQDGEHCETVTGDLIYEMVYSGKSYKDRV